MKIKATRCQKIGETVIKVAVATKEINLSTKVRIIAYDRTWFELSKLRQIFRE